MSTFGRREPPAGIPELKPPPRPPHRSVPKVEFKPPVDLSGMPKVYFLIGAGNSGKTTYARWLADRELGKGREPNLVALDPGQRGLVSWYGDHVIQPPVGMSGRAWLRGFVDDLLDQADGLENCVIVDFGGGGEESLQLVQSEVPDLHRIIQDAGVGLVAIYFLTPRLGDVFIPHLLAEAGFSPAATMFVMNQSGADDPIQVPIDAFGATINHSAFKAAIARGAIPIWMPRLASDYMAQIEQRLLPFSMVATGRVPPGSPHPPLNGLRSAATRSWLRAMEDAHAAVRSWID